MSLIGQGCGQPAWGPTATCWEFLAVSLRLPNVEVAQAVVSGEWGQAALEVAAELGLDLDEGLRRDLLGPLGPAGEGAHAAEEAQDDGQSVEAALRCLRAEYTRLFVYTPEAVVAPYESVWFAEERGIQPMLYVSRAAMEVERFCKQCGLGRPAGTNEPLDHVATECELLEYLAALAAGAQLPAGECGAGLPGGSAAAAYTEFAMAHTAWMPRFAAALGEQTRLPLYRVVAALLAAAVRSA